MVPPTDRLANLSLDGGMARRSQRLTQRQQGLTAAAGESSSVDTTLQAASGIRYKLYDSVDDRARSRAEIGLQETDVRLKHASPVHEDGAYFFTFELTDQMRIRIGSTEEPYTPPTCTCGATEDGIPCKVSRIDQTPAVA